jgi:hypothetical protein
MPKQQDLKALLNLITEAETILLTTDLPEGRAERARELLRAAVRLADTLASTPPPAAVLGAKGGKVTAKRGPEYFRKIAGMRKTRAGGRQAKNTGL